MADAFGFGAAKAKTSMVDKLKSIKPAVDPSKDVPLDKLDRIADEAGFLSREPQRREPEESQVSPAEPEQSQAPVSEPVEISARPHLPESTKTQRREPERAKAKSSEPNRSEVQSAEGSRSESKPNEPAPQPTQLGRRRKDAGPFVAINTRAPIRVAQPFANFCDENRYSYWEGIEELMKRAGLVGK